MITKHRKSIYANRFINYQLSIINHKCGAKRNYDDMGRLLEKEDLISYPEISPVIVNHHYRYNKVGFILSHSFDVNGQEIIAASPMQQVRIKNEK